MKRTVGILLAVLSVRCATMMHRSQQSVPVSSNPAGADVSLDCGSGTAASGVTPTVIKVARRETHCVITLRKEGWQDERVALIRHFSKLSLFNIVPGFLIGLAAASADSVSSYGNDESTSGDAFLVLVSAAGFGTDALTGAMWRQSPPRVDVTLQKR